MGNNFMLNQIYYFNNGLPNNLYLSNSTCSVAEANDFTDIYQNNLQNLMGIALLYIKIFGLCFHNFKFYKRSLEQKKFANARFALNYFKVTLFLSITIPYYILKQFDP